MNIQKVERGWAAHYICSSRCLFRRHTAITLGDKTRVVSTIGAEIDPETNRFVPIGLFHYFESMVFDEIDGSLNEEPLLLSHLNYRPEDGYFRVNEHHDQLVEFIAQRLIKEAQNV